VWQCIILAAGWVQGTNSHSSTGWTVNTQSQDIFRPIFPSVRPSSFRSTTWAESNILNEQALPYTRQLQGIRISDVIIIIWFSIEEWSGNQQGNIWSENNLWN
jgi:hypothetical protein